MTRPKQNKISSLINIIVIFVESFFVKEKKKTDIGPYEKRVKKNSNVINESHFQVSLSLLHYESILKRIVQNSSSMTRRGLYNYAK